MIVETLAFCAWIALLNTAVYAIAVKLNLIEWLQGNVPQWAVPSRCEFCMFHRLAFLEVLIHEIVYGWGWSDLLDIAAYPLAAAVLSLFFYRRQ